MIIKSIEIEKFRSFENVSFELGKRITAISGRNATQKTTVLGMIGQPFTISDKTHPMYGCKTVDGYNFRSQFKEKFKISQTHDVIGEHKWKLNLHQGVYEQNYYSVESIARRQAGHEPTLRFWNAESRAKGAGYIQLPVYFLSLSRLFPIGEAKKTQTFPIELTNEELDYCIDSYRTILSVQNVGESSFSVGVEKGSAARIFAGVNDSMHDIATNSAGEGNIMRIILAVLSFRRLKEKYVQDYKGGILLIDELDATLYGYSQGKLVDYLWKSAEEYRIQIVFTTHSPIILKRVNDYKRAECQNPKKEDTNCPAYAFDSAIVYLEPFYDDDNNRIIRAKNISTRRELNDALSDINLTVQNNNGKINIYCEDERATSFLKYALGNLLNLNLDLYMSFADVDLGWTNYVQLASKGIREFRNNIIVLDKDVQDKEGYDAKKQMIEGFGNFLFLPLTIEKDIFELLRVHSSFNKFQTNFSRVPNFNYDVCFSSWQLDDDKFRTNDYKHWFDQTVSVLGSPEALYCFWCREHSDEIRDFAVRFAELFNILAERNEVDPLPLTESFA